MTTATSRAGYAAPITDFLAADVDTIIGQLTTRGGDALQTQVGAWQRQIEILKRAIPQSAG